MLDDFNYYFFIFLFFLPVIGFVFNKKPVLPSYNLLQKIIIFPLVIFGYVLARGVFLAFYYGSYYFLINEYGFSPTSVMMGLFIFDALYWYILWKINLEQVVEQSYHYKIVLITALESLAIMGGAAIVGIVLMTIDMAYLYLKAL